VQTQVPCNCEFCVLHPDILQNCNKIPREIRSGPLPSLGGRVLPENFQIDIPSKSYTGTKYEHTGHLNQYTVEPALAGTRYVNQFVGKVAFSEVTTYYYKSDEENPPLKRPEGLACVEVRQAVRF
jgi:hypothetical protein